MTAKILIVEDETNIRIFLQDLLLGEGYVVTAVSNGDVALQKLHQNTFDLALLDLKLDGISGIDILTHIRQHAPDTTVIILTAYGSLETAVQALRLGAHDYLLKPCEANQIRYSVQQGLHKQEQEQKRKSTLVQLEKHLNSTLDNIRAVVSGFNSSLPLETFSENPRFLRHGIFIVDVTRRTVTCNGRLLELTPLQFELLTYLIHEAPRVVSSWQLMTHVYKNESSPPDDIDVIRAHIYRIRQKIKDVGGDPNFIQTKRGVGFAIKEE